MNSEPAFETTVDPSAELQDFLWNQLKAHGLGRLDRPELQESAQLATTAKYQGEVVGGLLAAVFYRGYNLQLLWIREDFRGRGLGKKLLETAEQQARAHGCTVVFGFSFGFQAPDFYLRAGYRVFGVIEDYPQGYTCHFLSKRLEPPGSGSV